MSQEDSSNEEPVQNQITMFQQAAASCSGAVITSFFGMSHLKEMYFLFNYICSYAARRCKNQIASPAEECLKMFLIL